MKLLDCLAYKRRTVLTVPTSLDCCNPSIVRGDGKWMVLVRALYPIPWDGVQDCLSTENWMLELDEDFNPVSQVKVNDDEVRHRHTELANGLEDGRIFFWNGQLWGLFSGFERIQQTFFNTMVLTRYCDGRWVDARVLPSPTGAEREKNWMPCVVGHELFMVHSVDPLRVFQYVDGKLLPFKHGQNHIPQNNTVPLRGSLISGSSSLVAWQQGFVAVVHHRRKLRGIKKLVMKYWKRDHDYPLKKVLFDHYLIFFDHKFNVIRRSRPFSFEFDGVEFCSGLHIEKDKIFLSYGVKDRIPVILEASMEELIRLIDG